MSTKKTPKKYYIESGVIQGIESHFIEPRWASYGTVVAEGNTLDELMDNATVDISDQDGGEVAMVGVGELSMKLYRYVEQALAEEMDRQSPDAEERAQALAQSNAERVSEGYND